MIGSTALFFKNEGNLEAYWRTTVRAEYVACFAEYWAKGRRASVTAEPSRPARSTLARPARPARRPSEPSPDCRPKAWLPSTHTTVFVSMRRGLSITLVASAYEACDCYTGLATDAVRRLRAAR